MSRAALAVWLRQDRSAAPRSRISVPNTQTAATGWPLFVSTGEATATDYYALIRHVQETVYKQTKVKLDLEVELVGEW